MSTEYGLNVGQFIADHRDWLITAGTSGAGYAAQLGGRDGRARGQRFTAMTLDQLAAVLEREDNRRQRDI